MPTYSRYGEKNSVTGDPYFESLTTTYQWYRRLQGRVFKFRWYQKRWEDADGDVHNESEITVYRACGPGRWEMVHQWQGGESDGA